MCWFKQKDPKPIGEPFNMTGYKPVFIENFQNPIDWGKWDWREPCSGESDSWKGFTIWKKECAEQHPDGIHLIAKRGTETRNHCGLISTHKSFNFQYGYVEVVAKVPPKGLLYFPAIWLYDKNGWLPEWDLQEMAGGQSDQIWCTHHWDENGTPKSEGINLKWKTDFSKDFHTYSGEWTKDRLTWYVDGLPYYTTTKNVPQVPLFLICNIQSGGAEGNFNHLFTPEESGQSMIIKSVQIWQR